VCVCVCVEGKKSAFLCSVCRGEWLYVSHVKDVTLLRENGDKSILRVHKDVTLLSEKRDMAIRGVRKDVTLQRENDYMEGT
jgi:hypothetical protein